MKPTVSVKHRGVEIHYYEATNNWAFYVLNSSSWRVFKSLTEAKKAVDDFIDPPPREAFLSYPGDPLRRVKVLSKEQDGVVETNIGSIFKQHLFSVCPFNADALNRIDIKEIEMKRCEKQISELRTEITTLRAKLIPFNAE